MARACSNRKSKLGPVAFCLVLFFLCVLPFGVRSQELGAEDPSAEALGLSSSCAVHEARVIKLQHALDEQRRNAEELTAALGRVEALKQELRAKSVDAAADLSQWQARAALAEGEVLVLQQQVKTAAAAAAAPKVCPFSGRATGEASGSEDKGASECKFHTYLNVAKQWAAEKQASVAAAAVTLTDAVRAAVVEGDTSKISSLTLRACEKLRALGFATVSLLDKELDEHAPELKAKTLQAYVEGKRFVKARLESSTAFTRASAELQRVYLDLHRTLDRQLEASSSKFPVLLAFRDPVWLEFLTGFILVSPLVVVAALIVGGACSSCLSCQGKTATASKSGKKKTRPSRNKSKSGAAATPGSPQEQVRAAAKAALPK